MPKIVNNGDGCALMKDLKKGGKRYSCGSFRNRTSVSVKFRSGYDEKHINAVEFGVMCEEAGAKSITVHGRTKNTALFGKSRLEYHPRGNVRRIRSRFRKRRCVRPRRCEKYV